MATILAKDFFFFILNTQQVITGGLVHYANYEGLQENEKKLIQN